MNIPTKKQNKKKDDKRKKTKDNAWQGKAWQGRLIAISIVIATRGGTRDENRTDEDEGPRTDQFCALTDRQTDRYRRSIGSVHYQYQYQYQYYYQY